MRDLQLFIGNRNYSPWSMRPWVLLKAFDLAFEEVFVRLDAQLPQVLAESIGQPLDHPSKVPVLQHGELLVWDSLAIAEYLAEKFAEKNLWPQNPELRALGRSLCAEMHSGFGDLRTHCGMNIEADLHEIGQKIYAQYAAVRADVARLNQIFSLQQRHGGAYLLGDFSIADAYFAPAVLRLQTYGLPFSPAAENYRKNICAHPAVAAWVAAARAEHDFLPAYEPYRQAP
jgi:glutathione S-transferase